MKCETCNQECEVVETAAIFADEAYGSRMLFEEIYTSSDCCGSAVVDELESDEE